MDWAQTGPGKPWLSGARGVAGHVVGGWQINTITTIETPFVNPSTVNVNAGRLQPRGTDTNTGTYNVAGGAVLDFNAGTHTEVIRMSYADFERLAKPRVLSFTT